MLQYSFSTRTRSLFRSFFAVPWQAPFHRHAWNRPAIGYDGNSLNATNALDASTQLLDHPDYTRAIDALMAGKIDVLVIPQQDLNRVQDTLDAPDVRLMSVAQAEAIAQTIPGLKHVVLWRGLLDLSRDIPNSNVDNQAVFDSGGAGLVSPPCWVKGGYIRTGAASANVPLAAPSPNARFAEAGNDNGMAWPFISFPNGWYAAC